MNGILAGLFEKRSVSVVDEKDWRPLGTYDTNAGVRVTPAKALQIPAVFACVRILAESVAALPLILYERRRGGGKDRASEHPLYSLLHDLPNPELTSYTFRETLMGHLGLWGNAYAEIVFNSAGDVSALWPLRVDKMQRVERTASGDLVYVYELPDKMNNQLVGIPADRILHVRGLGHNGLSGYSPIGLLRQSLGLAMATEQFGAALFKNGAQPKVILTHPGKLGPDGQKNIRASWDERHAGLENAHRIAILEEGMTLNTVGMPPEDAQFLETRKFQITEIARWYRIPPHMLADLDRATFSNIEHQSLDFVIHTLTPWLVRWEQEIFRSLLTDPERQRYFAEHLVTALLRGDTQSRYQAYAVARQNGWLSANDIREMENMNPVEGGDTYLVPLNMIPADAVGNLGLPQGMESSRSLSADVRGLPWIRERRAAQSAIIRHRLQMAHFSLYQDVAARVLRREANDVRNAARRLMGKRDLPNFSLWLEAFYREHQQFVIDQFMPLATSYGQLITAEARAEVGEPTEMTDELLAWISNYLGAFAARHVGISEARIREAITRAQAEGTDILEALESLLDEWPDARAAETARWESVRFNNALGVAVYVGAGVLHLRWTAFGESCPYCRALNGQTVGIQQAFIAAGSDFQPDGAETPLHVNHNVGHAPAHSGCDCMVVSG